MDGRDESTADYTKKLSEELRLRKYSGQTGKAYLSIVNAFIRSGLQPRGFLLGQLDKSRSSMRSFYFSLKFFYENVLKQNFDEEIPLAKNKGKLPIVLSKEEVMRMIDTTLNIKHRLVLSFLYYSGIRLNELINIKWEDIDFDRGIIHLKTAKLRNLLNIST